MTWPSFTRMLRMATLLWIVVPLPLSAQRAITRSEAVRIALHQSPRNAVAASDTVAANAQLRAAHEYPNPTVTAGYSKSVPQEHLTFEVPIDFPTIRRARIRAAAAGRAGAQQSYLADRAAIALDVDTLYSYAQLALERLAAANATAVEGEQLRVLAEARRSAGDASDLDVELVRINAAQLASIAARDTTDAVAAILDWQSAMGIPGDSVQYEPADTLAVALPNPPQRDPPSDPPATSSPRVAAAQAAVTAAQETLALQRANRFGAPSLQLGVEGRDPTGAERGILPTVGMAFPLPLFNHNGGAIATARADVDRSRAELASARLDAAAQHARANREQTAAIARAARDSETAVSAYHVMTLSRTAYHEGEIAIADVLQSQRSYRDVVDQYHTDLLTIAVNAAIVRALTGQPVVQP